MIKQINKIILSLSVVLLTGSASFSMEQPQQEMNFLTLPDEIKVRVLSCLDSKGLEKVSEVNRSLEAISKDEHLWKNLCQQKTTKQKPEGMTWRSYYKNYLDTKTVRLTATVNTKNIPLMVFGVDVNFNGRTYNIDFNKADKKTGRLPIAENIIIRKKDALKGLPLTYSIRGITEFVDFGDSHRVRAGSIPETKVGVVDNMLFQDRVSEDGQPLEPASIRVDFRDIYAASMAYNYDLKK